jgi:hypothetical protein
MDSHLERLRLELEDATSGIGSGGMAQAPAGKWSAAQILEHLFLTYKGSNHGVAKCLEHGAPSASDSTLKQRMATLMVLKFGYIPKGRNAPERTMPRGMPADELQQGIASELERMILGLKECERRFGARTKIMDHPFLGPLTAKQWRRFHWVHGRHHARQIRERIGKG